MSHERLFATAFSRIYPLYVQKALRKDRSQAEVDQIICWLTGYDLAGLQAQIAQGSDLASFFASAPGLNPKRCLITGSVCGVRVEALADPLMQVIRQLDKLIDELAKGRPLVKILRQ